MIMNARLRLNNYFFNLAESTIYSNASIISNNNYYNKHEKTISIVIDGQEVQVTTLSNKLDKILENEGIVVSKFDKVSVALDSEVKDGDNIYINKAVDVEVNVDGKVLKLSLQKIV